MAIAALLPPFAVARLGAGDDPVVNFRLARKPSVPGAPDRFQIEPAETIFVDRDSGLVTEIRDATQAELTFKDPDDPGRIRPVVPFFEVWTQFDGETELRPLNRDDLDARSLTVTWDVELGNWKAFRRTQDEADKIRAELRDHPHGDGSPRPLTGRADNFLPGRSIPLGFFQTLLTSADHPEVRARFLPPEGRLYGPAGTGDPEVGVVLRSTSRWVGHNDPPSLAFPPQTIPVSTYAGEEPGSIGRSRGFIDDTSDGVVTVRIFGPGVDLVARARIAIGPPDYAPDRIPFRSLADDFEYFEHGPEADAVVPDRWVADLLENAVDTAEVMQLERSRQGAGWPGPVPPFDPDEAREVHLDLLADARALVDEGIEQGALRNRAALVGKIREPGSQQGGTAMPLFMVGQDRRPLFVSPLQHARLLRWQDQEVGQEPPDDGPGPVDEVDPAQARAAMLDLIRDKRDNEDAARRHRRVRLPDGRRLSELFADEEALLEYLLTSDPIRNNVPGLEGEPLVRPGNLERSVFYQLLVHDEGRMRGLFTDEEIAVVERWILSLPPNEP